MKTQLVAFAMSFLVKSFAAGQSVADTIKAQENRLKVLEVRSGSNLVQTSTDDHGGQLLVANSNTNATVILRNDGYGGNIDLLTPAAKKSAYIGTGSNGGELEVFSKSSQSYTTYLGANGLFLYDDAGTKQLATFTRSADGTGGLVFVSGKQVHDYAEIFDVAEKRGIVQGAVVSASVDGTGIKLSDGTYDPTVVGVISGAGEFRPGMQIGSRKDGSSDLPVSVSGQVYVRVSVEAGHIAVGDLLVSSSVGGIAMRGIDQKRMLGTVIGKALQPYSGHGEPLIRMLVMLR